MGILADWQIAQDVKITPFAREQASKGVVSSGLGSYGYDARLGYKFKVFTNAHCGVVDPKNFDPLNFVDVELLPPSHAWADDADEEPRWVCKNCHAVTADRVAARNAACPRAWDNFILIPPNSFALGESLEEFEIPRDCLAIVLGKSTYARCFTGDTTVALVDGTRPTFKELVARHASGEKVFYGYGHNGTNYITQKLKHPRMVSKSERIFTVLLDNGEEVRCTKDHEFLLRSGNRVRADQLHPGDSLLPLYLHDSHGYESVYNPETRTWKPTHLLVEQMLIESGRWEPRSKSEDVHHIDEDKRNNHPFNLVRIDEGLHASLHNSGRDMSAQAKTYWNDPENKREHLAKLHTPEAWAAAALSRSKFYATPEGQQVGREKARKAWRNSDSGRRHRQAELMRAMNLRADVTEETLTKALREAGTLRGAARILNADRSVFKRFPGVLSAFHNGDLTNNHKVVSVKRSKDKEPVYCLTAPATGNFALGSGIMVSNCGIIINVTPLEPGWKGRVTIEISNTTPLPARVYAGEGIMQVLFFRADSSKALVGAATTLLLIAARDERLGLVAADAAIADVNKTARGCNVSYAERSGRYQNQSEITLPFVAGGSEKV